MSLRSSTEISPWKRGQFNRGGWNVIVRNLYTTAEVEIFKSHNFVLWFRWEKCFMEVNCPVLLLAELFNILV